MPQGEHMDIFDPLTDVPTSGGELTLLLRLQIDSRCTHPRSEQERDKHQSHRCHLPRSLYLPSLQHEHLTHSAPVLALSPLNV